MRDGLPVERMRARTDPGPARPVSTRFDRNKIRPQMAAEGRFGIICPRVLAVAAGRLRPPGRQSRQLNPLMQGGHACHHGEPA
ncbi:hypothetical protein G6F60_015625 [Rhizopus arrhizus]|nr:hypothetical protein G6F60_015625 [Rhizopus arrhizus]